MNGAARKALISSDWRNVNNAHRSKRRLRIRCRWKLNSVLRLTVAVIRQPYYRDRSRSHPEFPRGSSPVNVPYLFSKNSNDFTIKSSHDKDKDGKMHFCRWLLLTFMSVGLVYRFELMIIIVGFRRIRIAFGSCYGTIFISYWQYFSRNYKFWGWDVVFVDFQRIKIHLNRYGWNGSDDRAVSRCSSIINRSHRLLILS